MWQNRQQNNPLFIFVIRLGGRLVFFSGSLHQLVSVMARHIFANVSSEMIRYCVLAMGGLHLDFLNYLDFYYISIYPGDVPYSGTPNALLLQILQKGTRLERPVQCSNAM